MAYVYKGAGLFYHDFPPGHSLTAMSGGGLEYDLGTYPVDIIITPSVWDEQTGARVKVGHLGYLWKRQTSSRRGTWPWVAGQSFLNGINTLIAEGRFAGVEEIFRQRISGTNLTNIQITPEDPDNRWSAYLYGNESVVHLNGETETVSGNDLTAAPFYSEAALYYPYNEVGDYATTAKSYTYSRSSVEPTTYALWFRGDMLGFGGGQYYETLRGAGIFSHSAGTTTSSAHALHSNPVYPNAQGILPQYTASGSALNISLNQTYDARWHQFTYVVNGTSFTYYLDGQPVGTGTRTSVTLNTLRFGAALTGSYQLGASNLAILARPMSDGLVIERALSDAEVLELHALGRSHFEYQRVRPLVSSVI